MQVKNENIDLNSPYLAFAFLLLLLLTGSLVVQTIGHMVDLPLARTALFVSLPFALWLTYGRYFPASSRHMRIALILAFVLAGLGFLSRYALDFSADGLGYQQPSAEAMMNGWNPFRSDSPMLWQNIYPAGATEAEASLAFLYGSIEAAKMLQVWWLFIASAVLLSGLCSYKRSLSYGRMALAISCVLSVTVLNQILTHYVDSPTYLSGLTFIGGLLLHADDTRQRQRSAIIMVCALFFLINTKLSGIYHAVMLCAGAVVFLWVRMKRFPWRPACILLVAGAIAVLVIGYRPYVTSFLQYGMTLFPDDTEAFSGYQRPSSFDGLHGFERFFYSLFSVTGGAPHEPATLKWPWTLHALEWKFAGDPDARTGGLGPFFALGFVLSLMLFAYAAMQARLSAKKVPHRPIRPLSLQGEGVSPRENPLLNPLPEGRGDPGSWHKSGENASTFIDKGLVVLAATCLLSSALFPQSWWLRYVPFAYAVPFLLLLSISSGNKVICRGISVIMLVFAANSAMAFSSAVTLFYRNQSHFLEVAAELRKQPSGSVYLVPPVANYAKYNGAYMPLTRRLAEQGIATAIRIGAACPHRAEMYAEFALCY